MLRFESDFVRHVNIFHCQLRNELTGYSLYQRDLLNFEASFLCKSKKICGFYGQKFEYFLAEICKFSAYMILKWDKTLWKVHLWVLFGTFVCIWGFILFERLTLQAVKQFKSHYEEPFQMHLMFLIVNGVKYFKRDFFVSAFLSNCHLQASVLASWLNFMFFLAPFSLAKILKNFWLLDSLSKVIYFFFSKKQTIV